MGGHYPMGIYPLPSLCMAMPTFGQETTPLITCLLSSRPRRGQPSRGTEWFCMVKIVNIFIFLSPYLVYYTQNEFKRLVNYNLVSIILISCTNQYSWRLIYVKCNTVIFAWWK